MKKTLAVLFCALLTTLSGCLEFDSQEVVLRFDPANDRIDALFLYHGLFVETGNGSSDQPVQKALDDLDKALATGTFALWCNWPLKVNPTAKVQGPRAALLEHIEVETGGLFTDPTGVLCGYQFVRFKNAKALVKKLNTLVQLYLQGGTATPIQLIGGSIQWDDDTADILREFTRSGEALLSLEPSRITLRLPISTDDHRRFKAGIEKQMTDETSQEIARRRVVAARRAEGGNPADTSTGDAGTLVPSTELRADLARSASFRCFWDNEFSIVRETELTTISLGVAGADELRFVKSADGLYHDSLLKALRERGDTIEDGVPPQEIHRRFLAFGERDAKLPDELAAQRR